MWANPNVMVALPNIGGALCSTPRRKVWCPDGDFWRLFCVLYFQRAACSMFQTCILNSHQGHTMCGSMADIQSATAEIRR